MKKYKVLRWLPALLMMSLIFWFSAQTITQLPNFAWADKLIKKSGHMIGYALLAYSYWLGFDYRMDKHWIAWALTIGYALTDEYHQSFILGRHSTIWDVLIYDNLGALISLWVASHWIQQKRSASPEAERN